MKTEIADIPEADRVPGAPHPRHAPRVLGHDAAIASFTEAALSDRLHHAWMLTGPRGVGKATLAWAMARWLISGATDPGLRTDPDSPEIRRIASLAEPRLQLIRRPWDDKAGGCPRRSPWTRSASCCPSSTSHPPRAAAASRSSTPPTT